MRELCAILRATIFSGALVAAATLAGNYAFQAVKYGSERASLGQLQCQIQAQQWMEKIQSEQLERLLRPRPHSGLQPRRAQ